VTLIQDHYQSNNQQPTTNNQQPQLFFQRKVKHKLYILFTSPLPTTESLPSQSLYIIIQFFRKIKETLPRYTRPCFSKPRTNTVTKRINGQYRPIYQ